VTTPGGLTSTHSVTDVPCGTQNLSAVYPTQFTAKSHAPINSTTGTYTADWAGSTTALIGGLHPTFSITDNFVAVSLSPPPTVPEFGAPAMLVAACLFAISHAHQLVFQIQHAYKRQDLCKF
jgi:hypothetical protein